MHAGPEQAQELPAQFPAQRRNGNAHLAVQIARGERLRVLQQLLPRSREENPPAVLAGPGPEVQNMVGGADGVGIVLDDEHRVPQIAQRFQNVDQALRIPRVEADRGLVQHVQRAHQVRAERSGELRPLCFPARKRRGQPVEAQVVQPHFIKVTQPLLCFLENLAGDFRLRGAQLQRIEKRAGFLDGHPAHFGDGFLRDAHRARFRTKPRAAAFRAGGIAAITAQEHADVQFVFLSLEPVKESVHSSEPALGVAFENQFAVLGREVPVRHAERDTARTEPALRFREHRAVTGLGPRLDGAVFQRFAGVRNHAIQIEINRVAKSLTARAGSVGIVEGKQARLGFLVGDAAALALEPLVEHHALAGAGSRISDKFEDRFAASFAVADFDGVNQARARLRGNRKPVHEDAYRLSEVQVEERFRRGEFEHSAVLVETVEAALLQLH